jgi:hypothetical protein
MIMILINQKSIARKPTGLCFGLVVLVMGLVFLGFYQEAIAISLVQSDYGTTDGGVSVSATFTDAVTQNNLLVAIVGVRDNLTINTPSGWSVAIKQSGSPGQAIFYKIAGSSESQTVNFVNIISSSSRLGLHIYEYNGVNTLDQAGSNTGTGSSVSSGSINTTSANEAIIVGLVINEGTSFGNASWTNSFTEQNDFLNGGSGSLKSSYSGADRIVSATGTYSTTATAAVSGNWRGQIASFKLEMAVTVTNSTFQFGTQLLNNWLSPESTYVINDGTVSESFVGSISPFTDGVNTWQISPSGNGSDRIRSQWSITSSSGPWNNISAYDTDFTIATNVASQDSVTFWLRIQTPVSTTSYQEYSSTLTVTAQEY